VIWRIGLFVGSIAAIYIGSFVLAAQLDSTLAAVAFGAVFAGMAGLVALVKESS